MPREYIARLIYDAHHESLIILKYPYQVLAGICFRLFREDHFGEIVFCAVTATEQVKGYGSFMMNYFKEYVKSVGDIRYLLTYADNYAVGYFKKQGFSKTMTLDKHIWAGKIKDYDGGTLMECIMLPKVNYRDLPGMFTLQKQALLDHIKTRSKSHIVYPGLTFSGGKKYEIEAIPGVLEAGWTPEMRRVGIRPEKSKFYDLARPLLTDLQVSN